MSLKEYLLNLRNKLNQTKKQQVQEQEQAMEINYVYPSNDDELNTILTDTINNFFPTTGWWSSACFRRPNEILQSNLRNNKLLAKKILSEANLAPEYYNRVLDFINSSDLFKQKVHEYEQTIVKWQIEWIDGGGENWIIDENLGGDACLIMPYCDIAFRKGVVDTLVAMGMNKDAIEEGLEKNADMWRNSYIERAFRIKYEPVIYNISGSDDYKPLPKADLEHKQAWIKMRKYEYYCDHKKSVDLYGVVEPDMLLSKEELISLKSYLDIENAKRLEFISQHRKQRGKTKTLTSNK
ncbi:MAG: hypothetical protein IKI95_06530 [Clostridia bacterium]|nr:hypothetical protein [Clostridia bacterium]